MGVVFAEEFLRMLGTPQELLSGATVYLRVVWAAFLVTALMNLFSTALMSMGDSKTPLISMALSSAVNIVLDVVFLAWLRMGIAGAAIATVIAQVVAAAWNFREIMRKGGTLPGLSDFRMRWAEPKELLRLSLPQMLCSMVINSGDLLVQGVVNSHGVFFVMGINAARRYFNLLNIVGYGLEGAVSTYVGQNFGAKKMERIRTGTRFAVTFGAVTSAVIAVLICVLASPLLHFLLPDANPEAIRIGVDALRAISAFLPALYLLCEYRAAVQGMGNVIYPMLSGFSELIMRIAATLLFPLVLGRTGLYFVDAAAWVPTMVLVAVGYTLVRRKYARTYGKEELE